MFFSIFVKYNNEANLQWGLEAAVWKWYFFVCITNASFEHIRLRSSRVGSGSVRCTLRRTRHCFRSNLNPLILHRHMNRVSHHRGRWASNSHEPMQLFHYAKDEHRCQRLAHGFGRNARCCPSEYLVSSFKHYTENNHCWRRTLNTSGNPLVEGKQVYLDSVARLQRVVESFLINNAENNTRTTDDTGNDSEFFYALLTRSRS